MIKLIGWIGVTSGLGLAAADVFYPGLYLLWTGIGVAAFGVLLLVLGHIARKPPERIAGSATPAATRPPRGPQATVGQTYRALTRFSSGRGRIRVGTASVGAVGDEEIGPGDPVEVTAIVSGAPQVRKASRRDQA